MVIDSKIIAAFLSDKTTFKEDIFLFDKMKKDRSFFLSMHSLKAIHQELEKDVQCELKEDLHQYFLDFIKKHPYKILEKIDSFYQTVYSEIAKFNPNIIAKFGVNYAMAAANNPAKIDFTLAPKDDEEYLEKFVDENIDEIAEIFKSLNVDDFK